MLQVKRILEILGVMILLSALPVNIWGAPRSHSHKSQRDMFESSHDSMYTVAASSKLINSGEYTRAFVLLKKILAKNPNNKRALFNMGRIYTYSGEYRKAASYFIQGGDLRSLNAESAYDYGVTFYNLKDYPRSIRGFKRVSESSSRKDIARFYTGVSYFESQNLFQALINFKKARNIPDNLAEYRDNYINYIESTLSPQDRMISKKRYRRITRAELPEMAGITTKEKRSQSDKPSVFSFDLTPAITQSIDYESTEYSSDFYELLSYNYKFKLTTDLKLKVPATKSTKRTTFSLPINLKVNSCGVVEINKSEPENPSTSTPTLGLNVKSLYPDDDDKQDLLASMFQVCYAPATNDLQTNFSLETSASPRIDVPLSALGKLALLYAEYTFKYNLNNLTTQHSSMNHTAYAGLDRIGSSFIYLGTKLGFEYEDDSVSTIPLQTLSTESYLSISPLKPLTLSVLFNSEHDLNKDTDPPKEADLEAGGRLDLKFDLNDINTLKLKLETTIPVSKEENPPPGKEDFEVNTSLLYSLTHNIVGANLYLSANNLTSQYKYYTLNPNLSLSVASVLIMSLYDDFTYYSSFAFKDKESKNTFSEGAYRNIAYASLAYTPFSWLKIMASYLLLYNEFQLPDEIAETFYTTSNPYSTTKFTGILEIGYTF